MTRPSLVCAAALVFAFGAGWASAGPVRDVTGEGGGSQMPTAAGGQRLTDAGSAIRAFAPQAESTAAEAPAVACTPPGMPALDELVSVGHQTLVAPVEGTDETVTVIAVGLVRKEHLARYRLGELTLDFVTYFVRGRLAAVDDHPGDPSEPDLVDTGMVSPRGAALAEGTQLCHWERLPRTPRGDDTAVPGSSRI